MHPLRVANQQVVQRTFVLGIQHSQPLGPLDVEFGSGFEKAVILPQQPVHPAVVAAGLAFLSQLQEPIG